MFREVIYPMIIIIIVIAFAINFFEGYSCNSYANIKNLDVKWEFMDTCYIRTTDGWLTKKEFSAIISNKVFEE